MSVPPAGAPPADTGATPVAPRCYRHSERETWVTCTRCGRPICPDCMREAPVGFQCPDCVAQGRRTQRAPRSAMGAPVGDGRPVVTFALLGLNVLAFLASLADGGGLGSGVGRLQADYALYPPAVALGHQYYRLLTATFLHYGVLHIAFNMYALFLLGPELERLLGRLRYTALYLLAGLGGTAASYAFGPVTQLAAGASGAIFGLFGAYFVIARRVGADTRQIVGLIVINLVLSLVIPNIDIRGHLGGLAAGAAVAAAYAYAPRARRSLVQGAGVVAVAAVIVGLVAYRTAVLTG